MDKIGYVSNVENGFAEVEVQRISACGGGCKTCAGCDTPFLKVKLPNRIDAKKGDVVELQAHTRKVLKYTLIMYIIPITMFLFGIIMGVSILQRNNIEEYELLGFLIGLVFLVLSLFILRLVDRFAGEKKVTTIIMKRIVS